MAKQIHFIRHGQSLYNVEWEEKGNGGCFDPKLLDSGLSELGKRQAIDLGNNIKNLNVDLVVVSPLSRAIETAHLVFFNSAFQNLNVVVEHSLAERLEDSCDIGTIPPILELKFNEKITPKKFSHLDTLWWYLHQQDLENLAPTLKNDQISDLQKNKLIQEACLVSLENGFIEQEEDFKKRAKIFKNWLSKREEKNIAVVGHGEIFLELTNHSFANCELYSTNDFI